MQWNLKSLYWGHFGTMLTHSYSIIPSTFCQTYLSYCTCHHLNGGSEMWVYTYSAVGRLAPGLQVIESVGHAGWIYYVPKSTQLLKYTATRQFIYTDYIQTFNLPFVNFTKWSLSYSFLSGEEYLWICMLAFYVLERDQWKINGGREGR